MEMTKQNHKCIALQKRQKQKLKDYSFIPSNDAMAEPKVKTLILQFHWDTAIFL